MLSVVQWKKQARGVQTPTKGEALAAALIPCAWAGCETCGTPGRGTVAAAGVPTLGVVETLAGGTAITNAYEGLGYKGFKVALPLRPIVTHSSYFPSACLAGASLGAGLTLGVTRGQSRILCSVDWHQ